MRQDVKKMTHEEINEMLTLAAYAFNVEATEQVKNRFDCLIRHSTSYGCFRGNVLATQLVSTPFTINFHGVAYKIAGIGCVSSYPEYRGEGGVSAIMKVLLKELAEQNISLAYLAPFSYPFYRKYGFEQVFERIKYTIQSEKWPKFDSVTGTVRRESWDKAKEKIQGIYSILDKYRRGALIREDWWLDYYFSLAKEAYQFAIYANEAGENEGYLIYHSSSELFTIKEWGYLSKRAFQALAKFAGSHADSSHKFSYEAGFDGDNLSHLFSNPTIKMEIKPDMMARIVNFAAFLESYPFLEGTQEVYYLEVIDQYGFGNDGQWRLNLDATGQGRIEKITDSLCAADYDDKIISGTIQKWTQLFLGAETVKELYFYRELVGDSELVYSFGARLPSGKPILEDYF